MTSFKSACLFLGLLHSLYYVNAEFEVLKNEPGFVFKKGNNSRIKFEVFIDLMCIQSKEVYPELKKVANHYGTSDLELTFHLFPLPCFRNSHKVTKGACIVDTMTQGAKTNDWIKAVFDLFAQLTNSATNDKTETEIIGQLGDIAASIGIDRTTFVDKLTSSSDAEKCARMLHRYGSSRAVLTVPTFFINGFQVPATHSWTAQQFQNEIDDI